MSNKVLTYNSLHTHTDYSFLDSCNQIDKLVQKAKDLNMSAIAITDHGHVHGIVKFYNECKKQGIKPILGCLLQGQEIITTDGIKPVENIKIGDKVLTHKGRFRKVLTISTRIHDGELYNIKLSGVGKENLTLTDEHPVLIRDKYGNIDWVRADQITDGRPTKHLGINEWNSYVALPKLSGNAKCIDIQKYLPNWISIKNGICQKIFKRNKYESLKKWKNIPENIKLDYDFCYFLGMFTAEGSFNKYSDSTLNGGLIITLHLNEDEYVEKICNIIKQKFNLSSTVKKRSNKNIQEIYFNCLPLAYILSNLVGVGAHNKKVPQEILESDKLSKIGFLDGLLDGNGKNPNKKSNASKQSTLRVSSQNLAWGVKVLLADHGYWSKVSTEIRNEKKCYIVPISFERKYHRSIEDENYVWKPINSITHNKHDNIQVFNFEVEEDNSYVSNFILHNCEFYFTHKHEDKDRKSRHITILAKNNQGLANIFEMTSIANTPVADGGGFFYRPRISWDELSKYSDGLICLTGCMNSPMNHEFGRNQDYDRGKEICKDLKKIFKSDHLFVELQLVNDSIDQKNRKIYIPEQDIIYEWGRKVASDLSLRTVATNDCFTPETLINTIDGAKEIHEISIGENVYTHTGSIKKVEFVNKRRETKEIYNVTPSFGSFPLKCSDNHPFLVVRNVPKEKEKWKTANISNRELVLARDLKDSDLLCIRKNNIQYENRLSWSKMYPVWDTFKNRKYTRIHNGLVKSFRTDKNAGVPKNLLLNKDFFQILGLFVAEGWIDGTCLGFGFHENETELVETVNKYFKRFGFNPTIKYNENNKGCSIRINSFIFSHIFEEFGGKGNSNKKLYIGTKKETLEIIKYYIYGDGHFSKRQSQTFASTSKNLIWQISNILNAEGILSIPQIRDGKKCSRNHKKRKGDWKDQYVITYAGLGYERLCKLIGEQNRIIAKKRNPKYKEDDEYFYIRISDIKKEKYKGYLWNLQIEDDSTYQAQNICVHNSHYLYKDDAFAHEILKCIDAKATLKTPIVDHNKGITRGRLVFNGFDYHVKSADDMLKKFKEEDIKTTQYIADQCNVNFETEMKMPMFEKDTTHNQAYNKLVEECRKGWVSREINLKQNKDEYIERIKKELKDIKAASLANYFLIVWDVLRYCRENLIPVGPGRGSAAGSLVSYLLYITQVDPLKYGLLWERFWNRGRSGSMPDIDVDVSIRYKDDVVEYIKKKFGEDRVFPMMTIGKMESKAALKDVGRAMGLPHSYMNEITKHIPVIHGKNMSIQDSMKEVDILKRASEGKDADIDKWKQELAKLDKKNNNAVLDYKKRIADREKALKKTFEVAQKLEGCARNRSVHACALLISDRPINGVVPLAWDAKKKQYITGFDMYDLEDLGFLKLDILGLKTLDVIADAHPEGAKCLYEPEKYFGPWDDPAVYSLFAKGRTKGIFQLETPLGRTWCKKMKPKTQSELSDLVALIRPAVLEIGMADDYLKNRKQPDIIPYIHNDLEDILSDTYGCQLYQEQMIEIVKHFAGFTLAEADNVRKIVGKKKLGEMEKIKDKFINGVTNRFQNEKLAEELWGWIEQGANYGFNKSHSMAYGGFLGYITAYMKVYYPAKFILSLLKFSKNEQDSHNEIMELFYDSKLFGITVKPPSTKKLNIDFELDGSDIYFGLSHIKHVGQSTIKNLKNLGNIPWFCVLLDRTNNHLKKDVFLSLILSGAFDHYRITRKCMRQQFDFVESMTTKQVDIFRKFLLGGKIEKETKKSGKMTFEVSNRQTDIVQAITDFRNFLQNDNEKMKVISKNAASKLISNCNTFISQYDNNSDFGPVEKAGFETYYLGVPLTCSEVDLYEGDARKTHHLVEVEREFDGVGCCVIAIVNRLTQTKDKRDREMAFVGLQDRSYQLDAVIFSHIWEKYKDKIEPGKTFLIEGKKSKGGFQAITMEEL